MRNPRVMPAGLLKGGLLLGGHVAFFGNGIFHEFFQEVGLGGVFRSLVRAATDRFCHLVFHRLVDDIGGRGIGAHAGRTCTALLHG